MMRWTSYKTWCITLSVLTELQTTECGRGEAKKMWATKNLMLGTVYMYTIDHFTVSCLVTWPLNESEAGGDLVLIETSLLFSC